MGCRYAEHDVLMPQSTWHLEEGMTVNWVYKTYDERDKTPVIPPYKVPHTGMYQLHFYDAGTKAWFRPLKPQEKSDK